MGNDNEIKQLIRRESETFLNSALAQSKAVQAYDFEEEFAKTGKHRSHVVFVATAITIVALFVAALLVTRAIQRSIDATPVDVAAFEDLNLKDILDASKRNETDLERAKAELAQLDADLKAALAAADRDYAAAVESAKAKAQGKADETDKTAQAAADRDAAKGKLRASYKAAAAKKNGEIAAIQKRIDQYDSRAVEQAKKQQTTLANERLAFDIEKKKQADSYEARIAALSAARQKDVADLSQQKDDLARSLTSRYNPTFGDDRTSSLLQGWTDKPVPSVEPINKYLATAGILDAAAAKRLDKSLEDFKYLAKKMRSVPYLNSVPPSLSRLEGEAESSIAAYRAALAAAGSGLESRDKSIAQLTARAEAAEKSLAQYRAAVTAYAHDNRESGYILDTGSKDRLVLFLAPDVKVAEGQTGYVVRGDAAVATIAFHLEGDAAFAKVTSTEAGEEPHPFDSILVETPRSVEKQ
jgi:hypothetical protein